MRASERTTLKWLLRWNWLQASVPSASKARKALPSKTKREGRNSQIYITRNVYRSACFLFYDAGAPSKAAIQYTEYRSSLSLSIVEVHKNLKLRHLKVSSSNVVNIYGT
jgi:hypothetical protein